jgi:hypothetical protein
MLVRILAISALWLCCSVGHAEEKTVEIPLSEIWGYRIAGTRDIRDLEQKMEKHAVFNKEEIIRGSYVRQIRHLLSSASKRQNQESAGPVFAAMGSASDALKEASEILSESQPRHEILPADKDLSLVFYAYSTSRYLRLDRVSRQGNQILIEYHYEAHNTLNMSTHFALIPLGKLAVGEFHIEIKQLPGTGPSWGPEFPPIAPEKIRQLICDSTTFQVVIQTN